MLQLYLVTLGHYSFIVSIFLTFMCVKTKRLAKKMWDHKKSGRCSTKQRWTWQRPKDLDDMLDTREEEIDL